MKKNLLEIITGIILALATVWVIGFSAPKLYEIYKDSHMTETIKTDTVVRSDTIYFEETKIDTMPKVVYQTITKRDTLYFHDKDSDIMVPRMIFVKKKDYSDTLQMGQDTLLYTASVTGRSYEDEDYPKLDSISFILRGYNTKDKEIITNTITRQQKARKWYIGAQAGYGYGIINKKPDIFVGIGVSYTIW